VAAARRQRRATNDIKYQPRPKGIGRAILLRPGNDVPVRRGSSRAGTPESLVAGSVDLYDRDGLHIWADLNAEGALVISGQDLRPPFGWDEYEYSFTIPPEDLPLIGAALDGTHDNSVLNLLAAEGERIVPGVQSWLDSVGARYEFWNRM